ncbi:MAG: squalene--hopene cyclase, partial [Bryobacteraceae bacterium]
MSPALHLQETRAARVARAVSAASDHLARLQNSAGWWCAELTADSTLESDYILVELWRHPPHGREWNPPSRALVERAVESILARQLPDGGFNIYEQGPSEISATVKAYFALKVAGVAPDNPRMERARDRILALGGLQAANSYVKINLSLFGQYPREHVPSIPPELMLAGDFIYRMSSWTRAIVVSLAIVHAHNPRRPVPDGFSLDEIVAPGVPLGFRPYAGVFSWRNFFLWVDRALKLWVKRGPRWLRARA